MTRLIALLLTLAAVIAMPAATTARSSPSPFAEPWIDGTQATEPLMQIQRVDADTYVIRQSVHTNFEAPFLYLLFGKDRAILFDTGAGGLKIRPTIDRVVDKWLAENHRTSIPLIVAHSHGHGDHHQGDAEFADRPDTTLVGLKPEEVAAFFHIARWPSDIATFDLGGRKLSIIPTPGHQPAHIMVYDPRTRWLLSGDALYPGRLYVPVNHFADYVASVDRVAAFTRAHRVAWLMGTHIEMTRTPGKDFVDAAPTHPDERALELPYADLLDLQKAVHAMGAMPVREVHDDFIITPIPARYP